MYRMLTRPFFVKRINPYENVIEICQTVPLTLGKVSKLREFVHLDASCSTIFLRRKGVCIRLIRLIKQAQTLT